MYREKEYLVERLKEAGFNARIHESMKSLKSSGEIRTSAVIRYDDVLTRSGSKKHIETKRERSISVSRYGIVIQS